MDDECEWWRVCPCLPSELLAMMWDYVGEYQGPRCRASYTIHIEHNRPGCTLREENSMIVGRFGFDYRSVAVVVPMTQTTLPCCKYDCIRRLSHNS